jgi:uncharacterized protein (DUF1330 family)
MSIEMLVGLNVYEDNLYQLYRDKITPLLQQYGGGFGYDFKIAQVLKSSGESPINRVFTIYFDNQDAMNNFFSNEEYLEIKKTYFENSVNSTTIIASYER